MSPYLPSVILNMDGPLTCPSLAAEYDISTAAHTRAAVVPPPLPPSLAVFTAADAATMSAAGPGNRGCQSSVHRKPCTGYRRCSLRWLRLGYPRYPPQPGAGGGSGGAAAAAGVARRRRPAVSAAA